MLAALRRAMAHRRPGPGLLHPSDRGVPSACADPRALLAAHGLEPSRSRAGNPCDHAALENFVATDKRGWVAPAEERGGDATQAEARADFFAFAERYDNRERLHSALGDQSSVDFENQPNSS